MLDEPNLLVGDFTHSLSLNEDSMETNLELDEDHSSAVANATMRTLENYWSAELIERFQDKLGVDREQSELLFDDLKKFLLIAAMVEGQWAPPTAIDEAWHQFILYTREYAFFCNSVFGQMIHHTPVSYFGAKQKGNCRKTVDRARAIFGDLSENWSFADVGDDCAPSKPCDASTGGSDGSSGG